MAGHLRLLLARHGATQANLDGRYQGRSDAPLAAAGLGHAQRLGGWLAAEPLDLIVHSGSLRTAQTLQHAQLSPSTPVITDDRWREIDHGRWEGLTYQDLLNSAAEQARAHWADPWHVPAPNGETLAAVAERVAAAWADLRTQPAEHVLLIAHATPLQLLICTLLGTPLEHYWRWKLDLGSLSCIDLYAAGPIVNWLNRGYTPPAAC